MKVKVVTKGVPIQAKEITMKSINYSQLNPEQKEQVSNLIAQMEGQQQNSNSAVRFFARGGLVAPGGEFGDVDEINLINAVDSTMNTYG